LRNQVIRYQERGKKGIFKAAFGFFGSFGDVAGERGREAILKISNEGIAEGIFALKRLQEPLFLGDSSGFLNEKGNFWRAIPANLSGYCRRFFGKGELGDKEQGTGDRKGVRNGLNISTI
jgi:hypothetical protein